ncbi:MAG: molecular chaperone HtpG [Gammaproteobacteria bacterium]|nr:molecular chaperone HtpG [Gammaproteobacteria bacterium]
MGVEAQKETLGFQTEVQQLLDLMIHSLYSDKEIFLRELISNASDASDMLRFEALRDDSLYEEDADLKIRVEYNKDNKTITVLDNGIGMSREEVIEHLGTIAKSGTQEFFNSLTGDQSKDSKMIGQFGVGFYSSFIVAEKVEVTTRRAGAPRVEGVRWTSDGTSDYTIETVDRPKRGTKVVLYLREDASEFLDGFRLRHIIKKYSDHISLPIIMPSEDVGTDASTDDDVKVADKLVTADETVNSATALWTRNKKDIKEEEYNEFYKHVGHDFEDPLSYVHSKVEGKLEYSSLLYIPSRAPFDLWDRQQRHGIKLYVRRVFIMDDAEQLVPSYLRFIRGVVDSDDLPLNVSREILQRNKTIDSIRSGTTRKILDLLARMAKKEPEKYAKFWEAFGRVMKEGVIEETDRKEDLASLFRFSSTHEDKEEQTVSLADYVERMSEDQEVIYYVVADNFSTAKNSPHLEIFRKKGIEVLLLIDPIDEWLTTHLTEFGGKQLQSVTKGELNLGKLDEEKDKDSRKESNKESGELIEKIKKALESKVKDVRVTNRLTQSPACLVADEHDMGLNLERILKASGQAVPQSKPILEINIDHPVVKKLGEAVDEQFEDWSHILFDQALLSEGGELEDPAGFVHRLNNMFIALDSSEKVER